MKIVIEGKPIPKARPRFCHGKAYTPEPTREYESRIRTACTKQMQGISLLNEPLILRADMYFPIPKSWTKAKQQAAISGKLHHTSKPDATNVMKSIEDALSGIVYTDDSLIVVSLGIKLYSLEPHVDVFIDPFDMKTVVKHLLAMGGKTV